MMLGVIPNVNTREEWVEAMKSERNRFAKLQDKVIIIFKNIYYSFPSILNVSNLLYST